eukprot:1156018-Pelagomonas_calceolata.AAC.4
MLTLACTGKQRCRMLRSEKGVHALERQGAVRSEKKYTDEVRRVVKMCYEDVWAMLQAAGEVRMCCEDVLEGRIGKASSEGVYTHTHTHTHTHTGIEDARALLQERQVVLFYVWAMQAVSMYVIEGVWALLQVR